MTTTYIYTLSDPRDGNIRYVGRTTNYRQRSNQHDLRLLSQLNLDRLLLG